MQVKLTHFPFASAVKEDMFEFTVKSPVCFVLISHLSLYPSFSLSLSQRFYVHDAVELKVLCRSKCSNY